MPGIGHDGLRVQPAALIDGVLVKRLLGYHRDDSGHQGQHARFGQHLPPDDAPDGLHPVPQDAHPHHQEAEADDGRGQRFILAVPVVMPLVLRLGRDAHEDQHDDVRHEVRQRMHGIGQHSRAMPHDAGKELEEQQHEIDHAAHNGHLVNLTLARSGILSRCFHTYPFPKQNLHQDSEAQRHTLSQEDSLRLTSVHS